MAFGTGTAMKRVDPFQEFMGIQDRMNQLFRNSFNNYGEDNVTSGAWTPPVDIYEAPDAIELMLEIPGVNREDIRINFENNMLTISGERKLPHQDQRDGYHRVERNYGAFSRTFTLPTTIDPNKINAEFEQGLLRVTLPKRPETQPRAIDIKVK